MTVFSHPFFMVGFGSVVWFVLIFTIAKSRDEKKFDAKVWARENWDDFLLTLIVGSCMVIFDDEILEAYNDWADRERPLEFKSYFYLLPGPATDFLIRMVKKFKSR